ncbi:MAG TPA: hypothetical protein VLV81_10285 [Acidimicrobiia bacterium]|nr:hypothetical protein [Acidimicrobiia bacterium]
MCSTAWRSSVHSAVYPLRWKSKDANPRLPCENSSATLSISSSTPSSRANASTWSVTWGGIGRSTNAPSNMTCTIRMRKPSSRRASPSASSRTVMGSSGATGVNPVMASNMASSNVAWSSVNPPGGATTAANPRARSCTSSGDGGSSLMV